MIVIGAVVSSGAVILVEGECKTGEPVTLIREDTLTLEDNHRHIGYAVMHKRLSDRFSHGVERVVLMASSAGKFTGTTAALHAAELRGVLLSAVPANVDVKQLHKKIISRDYGSRKLVDYTKDEDWWSENFKGKKILKGRREAAFLILAASEQ